MFGKWHRLVPKEKRANLLFRQRVLAAAKDNPRVQQLLVEACRQDILFFINTFVYQYNPKKKPADAVGPFITWDFQDEAIAGTPETTGTRGILWCYEHDRSAVIEKSREMGATWLFLIVQDYLAIFFKYIQALNISRSADAVDCANPDSLFWKMRFMHRNLPEWLTGGILTQKMHFAYDRSGSVVNGEASTGRAGVGGRASLIFIDEMSKIKEAAEVRERTASTADVRFFNSTHEGSDTEFYKLTTTPEIIKIVMHWTQHPDKNKGLYRYNPNTNKIEVLDKGFQYEDDFKFQMTEKPLGGPRPGLRSPWYDRKCVDIGSERGIAVELDIDPMGSVSQFFNSLTIRILRQTYAVDPYWEGDIVYDRQTGKPEGLVQVKGGPLKLWLQPLPNGTLPRGTYTMGGDISTGNGATNSVLSAGNALTGEKVAEYATPHMAPEIFAPLACALGRLLKDDNGEPAYFLYEYAGPGMKFGDEVESLGYSNLYYRESMMQGRAGKTSSKPGWTCTNTNKRILLEDYRAALDSRQCVNRSDPALAETLSYRYAANGTVEHPMDAGGDDPSSARVNHGDRVIGDGLMWKGIKMLNKHNRLTPKIEEAPVGSIAWRFKLAKDRRVLQQ